MPKILVLAEHDHGTLKLATLSALGFARQATLEGRGTYEILVIGSQIGPVATALASYGAERVLVADDASLAEPLADVQSQLIADVAKARGADWVVGAASTYTKDILPRAAALLDAVMLSDLVGLEASAGDYVYRRVLYAGNIIATVQLDGAQRCFTVRAAAFPAPATVGAASPIESVAYAPAGAGGQMAFVTREGKASGRPDATEAKIVVSGGRALKNSEDFERLVGGLADVLGAAVGSSRALVDSGITPNSLQIGQTGKVVAPDLYVAVGISGAIQHMAGMKDTKVIAAINKDPDAPIFEVADYGLVADVYQAVPELMEKLKRA
ncbi:MAG: electron transfer flavoprotein subunit alpha/FixB family protein [Verrucomicrobiales bacterium]|nr:electron transfer flavoprotein subunit alpha/FixB family protein [Verrucomicrobiales bacterium]